MRTVTTIAAIRTETARARADGGTVGLVPTMGFFHAGHSSLMEAARSECDLVVVSSFVNPSQFAPHEDLAAYPRDAEGDAALATTAGVDVLFAPAVEEIYPAGASSTTVHVAGLTEGMCGAARPTHFDGVTTVVTKLFSIVGPSRAYFGRKDFQQLAVVRRMTRDLDLPVTVVGCPLVREADGLAMSSRNAYLTGPERAAAPTLFAALRAGASAIAAGERSAARVRATVRATVESEPQLDLEYVEVRTAEDLVPLDELHGELVVALAARIGRARLIDNVVVRIPDGGTGEVTVDLGRVVADGPGGPATS
ncbi:MAG: pantoate--beta-alanine ligase [Acidimicrobiia bacterium]